MKWIKKVSTTPLENTAKVIDSIEAQENDHINAPSINAVRSAVSEFFATLYPVGSIYMCIGNVNPGDAFGGVWEQIEDKFILASGTTLAGTTGGANYIDVTPTGTVGNHTLTTAEIPAHYHAYQDYYKTGTTTAIKYHEQNETVVEPIVALSQQVRDANTANTGGGGAHNHGFTGATTRYTVKPEYISVNVWKRVG